MAPSLLHRGQLGLSLRELTNVGSIEIEIIDVEDRPGKWIRGQSDDCLRADLVRLLFPGEHTHTPLR